MECPEWVAPEGSTLGLPCNLPALTRASSQPQAGAATSLADVVMACALLGLFQAVLGADVREQYSAVQAWLAACIAEPAFAGVLGEWCWWRRRRHSACISAPCNLHAAPTLSTTPRYALLFSHLATPSPAVDVTLCDIKLPSYH